jgi:hypothetical protein
MDEHPAATAITVDLPGEGTFVVPFEAIALDRANYMARQATGSGPSPGNDSYDAIMESELQFALSRPDILTEWLQHHMRRSELAQYRTTS